jgi:hypothetical protein
MTCPVDSTHLIIHVLTIEFHITDRNMGKSYNIKMDIKEMCNWTELANMQNREQW